MNRREKVTKSFPAKFPIEKPTDIEISTAMERLYDFWPSKGEFDNEFYTRFKYSNPEGFSDDGFVSRRDPSKVIRVDNLYYVYYTCRSPFAYFWREKRKCAILVSL